MKSYQQFEKNLNQVDYQSNNEGFLRFTNTMASSSIDAEKEAGAKMITESRREFYVRKGITEVMLGREKKEAINYF